MFYVLNLIFEIHGTITRDFVLALKNEIYKYDCTTDWELADSAVCVPGRCCVTTH